MPDPDAAAFAAEVEAELPPRPPEPPSPGKRGGKPTPRPLHYSTVPEALTSLQVRAGRGDEGSVLTGWPTIDKGLDQPILSGEVVMLAARTGVGKTWGITTILERTLRRDLEQRALLVSLEMTDMQIAQRLAAHALGVPPRKVWEDMRLGMTFPEDVMRAAPELDRLLLVDSSVPVSRLEEAIEHATEALGAKPGVVAVDYFGLLGWDGRGAATRYERTSENATMLKDVVKATDIVCLVAVQLSREKGGSGEKRPSLESLRDSGVAEETADRIIGLWRPRQEDEEERRALTGADVQCAILKNRFGPMGAEATLRYTEALVLEETDDVTSPYALKDERPAWWDGR